MGVAVSGWPLARAVSRLGQLGVVSGTALAVVLARRLQLGDPGGDLRRALAQFPFPHMAARGSRGLLHSRRQARDCRLSSSPPCPRSVPARAGGADGRRQLRGSLPGQRGPRGLVGINILEKIQLPTLPSLYGAMLAGVDYILMGAGIPRAIPGALDLLAQGKAASLPVDVEGALPGEKQPRTFDPQQLLRRHRPAAQAASLPGDRRLRHPGHDSGQESQRTRGRLRRRRPHRRRAQRSAARPLQLTPGGEPIYGPRDVPELEKIRALGLPFWLAGGYGPRASSPRPSGWAPPASRSARPLPSAKSPASSPSSNGKPSP